MLGELTADEERELEQHLEECPSCWAELSIVWGTHNALREAAATGPPPEVKALTLARAMGESPARSRYGWKLWIPMAAALLVVAVLGAGLFRTITRDSSPGVPLAATSLAPEASGEVHVEQAGENLQVRLEVRGMPRLEKDQYYEMWYYADDGGRISCGTFRVGPEGRATVNLTAPATARRYPEIEITREPDDGDPGASGHEVLTGSLVDI